MACPKTAIPRIIPCGRAGACPKSTIPRNIPWQRAGACPKTTIRRNRAHKNIFQKQVSPKQVRENSNCAKSHDIKLDTHKSKSEYVVQVINWKTMLMKHVLNTNNFLFK